MEKRRDAWTWQITYIEDYSSRLTHSISDMQTLMATAKGTAYVSAKGTTRAATRVIAKDSATLGGSCGTPSSEEDVQKRCVVSLDNPHANWLRVIEVFGFVSARRHGRHMARC